MIDQQDELYKDMEAVQQISIIPGMLDVVCRITGMGYAAVARVTEDRWLACCVRDDVNFGLPAGAELKIETTICNEIRDSRQPVVIDEVATDALYCHHHTPQMYGLQSYISFPIILKDGSFFGTLCAIDSKPAHVSKPEVQGTFKLFAELLAFHLQSLHLIDRSRSALRETNKILDDTNIENELYRKISNHNIQEQVRKISVFSQLLADHTSQYDADTIRQNVTKINSMSVELNKMMQHVAKFVGVDSAGYSPEPVALDEIVAEVYKEVKKKPGSKNILLKASELPVVSGSRSQLTEVFAQLMDHAITFADDGAPAAIHIYGQDTPVPEPAASGHTSSTAALYEIVIEIKGLKTNGNSPKDIFDLFIHRGEDHSDTRYANGFAYSRKIIKNHGGEITAAFTSDDGISFHILLPVDIHASVPALSNN